MRIGLDIDGVLIDDEEYVLACTTKFAFENNFSWLENPYAYTYKKYNWDDETIDKYKNIYLYEYFQKERSRRFSSEIVKRLRNEGNQVIIITSRWTSCEDTKHGAEVRKLTIDWLKKNNIEYDDIVFTKGDKVKECIDKKIDIMIEDSPMVIKAIKDIVEYVVCYDNRYNVDIKGKNIIRVFSWYDIYKKINELSNK